jgi:hypothetical protein
VTATLYSAKSGWLPDARGGLRSISIEPPGPFVLEVFTLIGVRIFGAWTGNTEKATQWFPAIAGSIDQ